MSKVLKDTRFLKHIIIRLWAKQQYTRRNLDNDNQAGARTKMNTEILRYVRLMENWSRTKWRVLVTSMYAYFEKNVKIANMQFVYLCLFCVDLLICVFVVIQSTTLPPPHSWRQMDTKNAGKSIILTLRTKNGYFSVLLWLIKLNIINIIIMHYIWEELKIGTFLPGNIIWTNFCILNSKPFYH